MNKSLIALSISTLALSSMNIGAFAKPRVEVKKTQIDVVKPIIDNNVIPKAENVQVQYTVDILVKDIPKGQQTLFIPIKIDTMILDFDKVALEGLSTQNILAVASNSKDKVGTGIGLIKLDDSGLPETLNLKAILKPVGEGQTSVVLTKVAEVPALPSKGLILNEGVKVLIDSPVDIEVTEKIEGSKKKLLMNQKKVTLNIQRDVQKEEAIFIPLIYDKTVADIDETFGHTVIAQGVSMKTYGAGSLNENGPGLELLLSADSEKDFTVNLDLLPKKAGLFKFSTAFPQAGHSPIVRGPVVDITPKTLTVASSPSTK